MFFQVNRIWQTLYLDTGQPIYLYGSLSTVLRDIPTHLLTPALNDP
jgi:hypothetical protein